MSQDLPRPAIEYWEIQQCSIQAYNQAIESGHPPIWHRFLPFCKDEAECLIKLKEEKERQHKLSGFVSSYPSKYRFVLKRVQVLNIVMVD